MNYFIVCLRTINFYYVHARDALYLKPHAFFTQLTIFPARCVHDIWRPIKLVRITKRSDRSRSSAARRRVDS